MALPPNLFREYRWFSTIAIYIYVLSISSTYSVDISIEEPQTQQTTLKIDILGTETFDGLTAERHPVYETNFGNSSYRGTYEDLPIVAHDMSGGAGGKGFYPVVDKGNYYRLKITQVRPTGLNYFGLWISAFDTDNRLNFYNNEQVIYTFNAQDANDLMEGKLGYKFNPTSWIWLPIDNNVFVNIFFDQMRYDEVRFIAGANKFESDNHSVGFYEKRPEKAVPTPTLPTAAPGAIPTAPSKVTGALRPVGLIVAWVGIILLTCYLLCAWLSARRQAETPSRPAAAQEPGSPSFFDSEAGARERDAADRERRASLGWW